MTETEPDARESVAELFRELFELAASERAELYRQRQVPDTVRDEVEALLTQPLHEAFAEEQLGTAGRGLARGAATVPWEAGMRIGDYEIVGEVARGGMGVVFEARQLSLGRSVAIKVVRGAHFADPSDARRFRAEAEAIARLDHPGIVPVHEVAEQDGLQFYSMGFFSRGSLADLDQQLSPIAAAELVAQICDAIHYAHTQDIVHRDLKPANVLLTETLQPKVSDFGVAKDIGEGSSDLTRTGAILGTPGFMAPEQASGDHETAGHLTDIYGLGAVLFYVLTGKPPIAGRNLADALHKVVHEEPRDVRHFEPGVPADVAGICRKALEKDPAQRYGSAAAMATDLRRFLTGAPTDARPLGAGQRLARWCRRRPTLAAAAALAILGIVGGGTTSLFYALEANDKTEQLATANADLERSNTELLGATADAEAFSAFLLDDIVRTARTADLGGINTDVSVRDALLAAIPRIAERFANRPLAEAAARNEIGITLQHVGEHDAALEQLRLASQIRERELGLRAERTLASWISLGDAYLAADQHAEAVAQFEALRELVADGDATLHHRVLEKLAMSYAIAKRHNDAKSVLQGMLATATGTDRLRLLPALALMQAHLGERDQARATLTSLDESNYERPQLPLHDLEHIEHTLLRCYIRLGDDQEVSKVGMGLLYRARRVHGQTHPITIDVARRLSFLGDRRLPPRVAMEALETLVRRHRGDDCARNRRQSERAARMSLLAGHPDRAHPHAVRVHGFWYTSDPQHAKTFVTEALLCEALIGLDRQDEARTRLESSIEPLRGLVRESSPPGSALADQHADYQAALAHFNKLLARL